MKLATISDIHGFWANIEYPKADILIFAGDLFNDYSSIRLIADHQQLEELKKFNEFLGKLKQDGIYEEIIVVAGNHDFVFELIPESRKILTNAHYLQNSEIVLNGIKFYGSPSTPWFHNWSFNLPCHILKYGGDPKHAEQVTRLCWSNIPDDTNVLITHGPPLGILDLTFSGIMAGCPILEERLNDLKELRAHIFGHIHYSYGRKIKIIEGRPVDFINTAICQEPSLGELAPLNPIPIFEL